MNDETNGMNEPAYSHQEMQQAMQQQEYGNMGFYADDRTIENARVYYLESDELLNDIWKMLTGRETLASPRNEQIAMMSDVAATKLLYIIRLPVDKMSRLSTYDERQINQAMLNYSNTIAGWLNMQGGPIYNIKIDDYPTIQIQLEQVLLASFNWAKNSGGQRFMTTTNKSVESQSQILSAQAQGKKILESRNGGMLNKFKPF